MELKKAFAILGTVVLSLSATAGIATAADEDSLDMSLSLLCTELSDITISGNGTFDEIDMALNEHSTQTAPNALTVEVDSGCDFGPWHVDAEISRFQNGLASFAGEKFSLDAGPVTSYFDGNGFLVPDPPTANDAEFDPIPGFPIGDAGSEAPIFETTNIVVFGFPTPWDYPAPFVSTAQFTGHLDNVNTLVEGTYTATLTVILVKD
jgi:hypothetical protein